jgi:hypothetical protein
MGFMVSAWFLCLCWSVFSLLVLRFMQVVPLGLFFSLSKLILTLGWE